MRISCFINASHNEIIDQRHLINEIKGLLILLVVIGHAIQYVMCDGIEYWNNPAFKFIYIFHMPMFMIISGYLSYKSLKNEKFVDLVKMKFTAFLLPVLVWSTLYVTVSKFRMIGDPIEVIFNIIKNALGNLWYLWVLFFCIVIISCLSKVSRNYLGLSLFLWVILLSITVEQSIVIMMKYLLPFYVFGIALNKYNSMLGVGKSIILFIIAIPLFLLIYLSWNQSDYVYVWKYNWSVEWLSIMLKQYVGGMLGSYILLFIMQRKVKYVIWNWLAYLGEISIYIYILQSYYFAAIQKIINRYDNYEYGIITALCVVISVILFSVVIERLLSKKYVLNLLLFGRNLRKSR